ncbi:MAG: trigger factor [Coriobacteriales bacterium]|jgi:trigger factor|nr:trigger factor [Coriobacteriales bacterium]
MKIKRSTTSEGKIELEVTAPADKVQEAIRFVDFQLALQNGIQPQRPEELNNAVKEKLGEAYYNSFLEFEVARFLAPFAVTQEKLAIIGSPKVSSPPAGVTPGKELSFTVEVTPKPVYELSDFSPVKIQSRRAQVSDTEVEQQLVMLAERAASLEKDDDRPVAEGDIVLFSLKSLDEKGEEIAAFTAERRSYGLGRGGMPADFDKNLIGMKPGETRTFTVSETIPQAPDADGASAGEDAKEGVAKTLTVTFTVELLEIQKRVIPAITDAWVEKNIPNVKTVPELREEIRKQGLAQREQELAGARRFFVASELAKRFKGKIPDELYEMTRNSIVQSLQQSLREQGRTLEEFIQQQAGDEQQFSMQLMMQAREMLAQGFSLDALARHLELEVTDEDIAETFRLMAPGHEKEARMEFELTGRMYQVHEGALRNKANKWLLETAEIEYLD